MEKALAQFPDAHVVTKDGFIKDMTAGIDSILAILMVLLALAVIVSLFGIVNTLVLSTFERTRELGMLRAVGMTRRQVRRMIRHESIITALLGAAMGITAGLGIAALLASVFADEGITFAIPVGSLVAFASWRSWPACSPPSCRPAGPRGWTCSPRSPTSSGAFRRRPHGRRRPFRCWRRAATTPPMDAELARVAARLEAFHLIEAVQTEDGAGARGARAPARRRRRGAAGPRWCTCCSTPARCRRRWSATSTRAPPASACSSAALLDGTPAMIAAALAFHASTLLDADRVDASDDAITRAVSLLDGADGPALELVTALVQCALVYERRRLWELCEELLDRAAALLPECEDPLLEPVVLHNLVEIELEWSSALRELGDSTPPRARGERGLAAARGSWRSRCRSCGATTASRWASCWAR